MSRFTVSFLPDRGISTYSIPESSNMIYTQLFSILLFPREVQRSKCSERSKCLRDTCYFLFLLLLCVSCLSLARTFYECVDKIIFKENVLFDDCFCYLCDIKLVLVNKINYITCSFEIS